jgi:hypothetical protein
LIARSRSWPLRRRVGAEPRSVVRRSRRAPQGVATDKFVMRSATHRVIFSGFARGRSLHPSCDRAPVPALGAPFCTSPRARDRQRLFPHVCYCPIARGCRPSGPRVTRLSVATPLHRRPRVGASPPNRGQWCVTYAAAPREAHGRPSGGSPKKKGRRFRRLLYRVRRQR